MQEQCFGIEILGFICQMPMLAVSTTIYATSVISGH